MTHEVAHRPRRPSMCSGVARAIVGEQGLEVGVARRMPERARGELALLLRGRMGQRLERGVVRQEVEAGGRCGGDEHERSEPVTFDQRRLDRDRTTEAVACTTGVTRPSASQIREDVLGVLTDRAAVPGVTRCAGAATDQVEGGDAMGVEIDPFDERIPHRVIVLEAVHQYEVGAPANLADGNVQAADRQPSRPTPYRDVRSGHPRWQDRRDGVELPDPRARMTRMCRNITILRGLRAGHDGPGDRGRRPAVRAQGQRGAGACRPPSRSRSGLAVRRVSDTTTDLLRSLPPRRQPPTTVPPLRRLPAAAPEKTRPP